MISCRPVCHFTALLLAAFLLNPARSDAAMVFNFTKAPTTTLANYNLALPAFTAAANYWSSQYSDNITVNIQVGYETLSPGVLGQAGSAQYTGPYSLIAGAIAADATTPDDATAVSNLQFGPGLELITNVTGGAATHISNSSAAATTIVINGANAKALGLLSPTSPGLDAAITFSNSFTWDFDNSDGVTGFDIVGVAIHEIGHSLGFTSGVDDVDFLNGATVSDSYFTPLDLFRYTSASLADPTQPSNGSTLGLTWGGVANFSIDGGATTIGTFSTGPAHGDGRQASHWKDGLGLGIMDPTFAPGELGIVTLLDLRALDVIGYDRILVAEAAVPEPSTMAMIGVMLVGIKLVRRRKTA